MFILGCMLLWLADTWQTIQLKKWIWLNPKQTERKEFRDLNNYYSSSDHLFLLNLHQMSDGMRGAEPTLQILPREVRGLSVKRAKIQKAEREEGRRDHLERSGLYTDKGSYFVLLCFWESGCRRRKRENI